jgi:beta-phosphoglucomutase-like phosphatase (HAD superfamily)
MTFAMIYRDPTVINFVLSGAIFDVDDTLLDNAPGGHGLHEQSRLAAAQEVGRRHNLPQLVELSVEINEAAFRTATVHTLEGAVWNTFLLTGLTSSPEIDLTDPLLLEFVTLKNQLHEVILRREGKALPGAVAFVRALAARGLADKLAVASTAIRRDIDIFFELTGLGEFFPESHIISKESFTRPKPDPEAFDLAFASLGLAEADRPYVCAFEDDPRGITAAQAAGLYTCAITTRYSREALLALPVAPHVVADSYQEFAKHFDLTLQV